MTEEQMRERIGELTIEADDLKQVIVDNEPNIEDFKEAIEQHHKRDTQRDCERQLGLLVDEINDLKSQLL